MPREVTVRRTHTHTLQGGGGHTHCGLRCESESRASFFTPILPLQAGALGISMREFLDALRALSVDELNPEVGIYLVEHFDWSHYGTVGLEDLFNARKMFLEVKEAIKRSNLKKQFLTSPFINKTEHRISTLHTQP